MSEIRKPVLLTERELLHLNAFLDNVEFHVQNCVPPDGECHRHYQAGVCGAVVLGRFEHYDALPSAKVALEKAMIA